MADVEPPLLRTPLQQHGSTTSVSRPTSANARFPTSPRMSAPNTPDQERGTDPLSAHIIARTQTGEGTGESPGFRRGLSELVLDKAREIVAPESGTLIDSDKRDRKKRVSFFAKLRGQHAEEEDRLETTEELNRSEGTDAATCQKAEVPKYIRVRSSNKAKRDFDNLFLAQELTGDATSETASTNGQHRPSAIWSMKFSNDGKFLATGGQDMVVRVWRVLSSPKDRMRNNHGEAAVDSSLNAAVFCAKPHREYRGHTADVLDLSWSKNNFLLSSSMDKTVRLWHVTRDECLCCFQHSDFVTSIAFHPMDDKFFVSGSLDCKLRLWNIADKQVATWNELPELITAVAFSPSGRMVIAGSFTGLCLFYETDGLRYHTQIHVRSSRGRNSQGSKITGIQAISMSPDNPHSEVKLLITSNDSRIRMYNLRDKSLETKFKGNENKCSQIRATFNDGLNYVICGSEDRQVYIWDAKTLAGNKDRKPFEHFESHSNIVTATAFAPNKAREHLAASGDPIYDIVTHHASRSSSAGHSTNSHDHSHDSATHNATDGNIVVCADYNGRIKVFRQDSAMHLRNRTSDRAETASIRSSTALTKPPSRTGTPMSKTEPDRPASVVSHDSVSVVRKPHEFVVPTSPARARTGTALSSETSSETRSTTPGTPSMQLNGTPIKEEGTETHEHKDHAHHGFLTPDHAKRSVRERRSSRDNSPVREAERSRSTSRTRDQPRHRDHSTSSWKDLFMPNSDSKGHSPHHRHHRRRSSSRSNKKNRSPSAHSRDRHAPRAALSEGNPYISPNGESLGYYDIEGTSAIVSRPANARMESTASWTDMQTTSSIRCRTCGSHTFNATQSGGEMRLTCMNCHSIHH